MNQHLRRALTLAAGAAASVALLALRPVAGPGHDPWTLAGWRVLLDQRGPVIFAFAALRVAMLVVAALLLALGLLHALAAGHGGLRLARVAGALTPRVLRPFLGVVTFATLSVPAMAGAAPPGPSAGPTTATSPPPVMVLVDTTAPTGSPTTAPIGAPPTMRRVGPTTTAPSTTSATTTSTTTTTTTAAPRELVVSPIAAKTRPVVEAPAPASPAASSPTAPATWTIRRGEHLWSIAEHVTAAALARDATDAEVEPYWRALIAANRDRLIDRDNPDLVHAGQELVLPPYAARAR